ncbi:MAG TPA: hypothetical protein VJ327_11270 [Patescibacteria group bacterium]|nr:hypothetical protein [Patescibacteria group bacterium]
MTTHTPVIVAKPAIETLFDTITADLIHMLTSKKLTVPERLKIFEILLRNYYPLTVQREILQSSSANPLLDRISGMLRESK